MRSRLGCSCFSFPYVSSRVGWPNVAFIMSHRDRRSGTTLLRADESVRQNDMANLEGIKRLFPRTTGSPFTASGSRPPSRTTAGWASKPSGPASDPSSPRRAGRWSRGIPTSPQGRMTVGRGSRRHSHAAGSWMRCWWRRGSIASPAAPIPCRSWWTTASRFGQRTCVTFGTGTSPSAIDRPIDVIWIAAHSGRLARKATVGPYSAKAAFRPPRQPSACRADQPEPAARKREHQFTGSRRYPDRGLQTASVNAGGSSFGALPPSSTWTYVNTPRLIVAPQGHEPIQRIRSCADAGNERLAASSTGEQPAALWHRSARPW